MYNYQFSYCPYYMKKADYPSFNSMWRKMTQRFAAFSGTVTRIQNFNQSQDVASAGCNKLMSLENKVSGPVNFQISPETYFVDHEVVEAGDSVTGFYDANAPAILIYPPQFPAIVMAKNTASLNVIVDYFNNELISSDGNLKLNLAPSTKIILTNDQPFDGYPGNRSLIVVYGPTTRSDVVNGPTTKSIPAQTTPIKIIVLC